MKAMILAAGQGTRLRPLTEHLPKPLIKVGPCSLIEHHIHKIAKAGFESIIINTAYLGKKIEHALGTGSRYGIDLKYSYEGTEALETGGGIAYARPLLGDDPILIVSADIYTDIIFDPNFNLHTSVHLIMVNNPAHHPEGDFTASQLGMANSEQRYTYSGVAYIAPKLFRHERRTFALSATINQAISDRSISAQIHTGSWFDVGTISRLHAANRYALQTNSQLGQKFNP